MSADDERIIQLESLAGMLYGLTNQGRLFAFGQGLDIRARLDDPELRSAVGWYELAGAELPSPAAGLASRVE